MFDGDMNPRERKSKPLFLQDCKNQEIPKREAKTIVDLNLFAIYVISVVALIIGTILGYLITKNTANYPTNFKAKALWHITVTDNMKEEQNYITNQFETSDAFTSFVNYNENGIPISQVLLNNTAWDKIVYTSPVQKQ